LRLILFSVIALLCFFTPGSLPAQQQTDRSPASVVENVQEKYRSLRDASADFTQTISFKYTKVEQKFSGTVKMKKGNNYRIESQHQTLVANGSLVWIYTPLNNQVLLDTYRENTKSFSPEKFLFGLPKNFTAVFITEKETSNTGAVVLKLVPREKSSSVVTMLKVWVTTEDWMVKKVEYTDVNNTRTVYRLTNVRINIGLDESIFQFVPPAGVEIVDLRSAQFPKQ
jgi:outer membrane lipoprotein carrier protein